MDIDVIRVPDYDDPLGAGFVVEGARILIVTGPDASDDDIELWRSVAIMRGGSTFRDQRPTT